MDWGWVVPVIGGILGAAGRSSQRRADERAQREYAEKAAARNNKLAQRTHLQQVLSIQNQYQNAVRQREWQYLNAYGQYALSDLQAQLRERRQQFDFAFSEVARKQEYDRQRFLAQREEGQRLLSHEERVHQILMGNERSKGAVAQHNFDVEQRFWEQTWANKLHDLSEDHRLEMEEIWNQQVDSLARQRYNISVGKIAGEVFAAQVAGNKMLTNIQKDKLQKVGARLALGQSGNSVLRLMGDVMREQAAEEEDVLSGMESAAGQGIVAQAEARLKLAEALDQKRRSARRVARGAVMGQRAKHFDMPDAPEFIRRPDMPGFVERPLTIMDPYVRDPAPVRGPRVPKPQMPLPPLYMTPEEVMGGASGGGGSLAADLLGVGLSVLEWGLNRRPTPAGQRYGPGF